MKKKIVLSIALICCAMFSKVHSQSSEIGKPYQGWKKGDFDINFIFTGRGESNFLIFPDGTSLLLDAGAGFSSKEEYPSLVPALPDSSKSAGEWIAEYIQKTNPAKNQVDYFLVSHFHGDHMGSIHENDRTTVNRSPNYVLTGVTEVAETIKFDKVIDRDYSLYNYPAPISNPIFNNYKNWLEWEKKNNHLQIERFRVGTTDQIVLKKDPARHPNFKVYNLFANGIFWNWQTNKPDTAYRQQYQFMRRGVDGNAMSNGIKVEYGPFSFYSGGDLSGNVLDSVWQQVDIQEIAAKLCGPVNVAKINHHGYLGSSTQGFVDNINADCYVACVWDYQHIQPTVIETLVNPRTISKKSPLLFYTYFPPVLLSRYENEPWMKNMVSGGHVIVKAFDNGKKYKVYLISAGDQQNIVKAVYGPFDSANQKRKK